MAKRVDLSCDRPRFVAPPSEFDPSCDLQEVDQFGFVNLDEAFSKGIIPGGLSDTEESFNGIQNPGTLVSRCMDVFDGLRKREYVKNCLDKLNAEERERVERQLETQAAKDPVTPSE